MPDHLRIGVHGDYKHQIQGYIASSDGHKHSKVPRGDRVVEVCKTLDGGSHERPIEKGGLSMLDLNEVMRWDCALQQDLVQFCAEMLEETVERNNERKKVCDLKSFVGKIAPISPSKYVRRIFKHSKCSPSCLVVACMYLQRLKDRNRQTYLTSTSFQRMFAVAVLVAVKYLDDDYFSNQHWAEIAGISNKELNALEVEFLFRVGFELNISRASYNKYVEMITCGSTRIQITDCFKHDEEVVRARSYTDVSEAPFADPGRLRKTRE